MGAIIFCGTHIFSNFIFGNRNEAMKMKAMKMYL